MFLSFIIYSTFTVIRLPSTVRLTVFPVRNDPTIGVPLAWRARVGRTLVLQNAQRSLRSWKWALRSVGRKPPASGKSSSLIGSVVPLATMNHTLPRLMKHSTPTLSFIYPSLNQCLLKRAFPGRHDEWTGSVGIENLSV